MVTADHPCFLLPRFLSLDLCKVYTYFSLSCFVRVLHHRNWSSFTGVAALSATTLMCSPVSYRPNVFSITLSPLIATDCSHLILSFLSIRDRIKEKVEDFFGCKFDLFIEFTGLNKYSNSILILCISFQFHNTKYLF